MPDERAVEMSEAEFRDLFQAVRTWGRWGEDDERGALNEISAEHVVAAARLVRTGDTIALGLPLNTEIGIANPQPAEHRMTQAYDADFDAVPVQLAKDWIGIDYHNDSHTHIDAFCHVAFEGALYNGRSSASFDEQGATANTIEAVKNGLVGRGVLLDVPGSRGVPWLEPGDNIFREDLEAAEREQGVTVAPGDVLLVRTGLTRRLAEKGPWDTPKAKAGLHPSCVRYLADRRIAALCSDGNSDTAPSAVEGIDFPIHTLALVAMGIHLLDYVELEALAGICAREGRWEFLFVGLPLRIVGGTGSPLNPLAIF
jgi:kynurenine formamidase